MTKFAVPCFKLILIQFIKIESLSHTFYRRLQHFMLKPPIGSCSFNIWLFRKRPGTQQSSRDSTYFIVSLALPAYLRSLRITTCLALRLYIPFLVCSVLGGERVLPGSSQIEPLRLQLAWAENLGKRFKNTNSRQRQHSIYNLLSEQVSKRHPFACVRDFREVTSFGTIHKVDRAAT